MNTVKTAKGTVLPLLNLKGKSYLMVAHRLQWFVEENERFVIGTDITGAKEDMATVKARVTVMDQNGKIIKQAEATKTETRKDFPDFLEKAETAAIGRALAMLGYGTQHALSDLDEGTRIVDTPIASKAKTSSVKENGATANKDF